MVGMENFQDRLSSFKFWTKKKSCNATVLASKPKLLVLDEPASNLDPASRRDLIDILIKLDISIILVTHDLPMALEICERSLVLNEGIIKKIH